VANRDRRPILITAPRRDGSEARLGDAALLRDQAEVVDLEGNLLEGPCSGNLVLADSWPGQMRTIYGDMSASFRPIFQPIPGKYFTAMAAAVMMRLLLDHRPGRRCY